MERSRTKKSAPVVFILIAAAVISLGIFSYARLLDTYEFILLDLRFKSRPLQPINPDIAIIEIGNDTLTSLGQWPIKRDYHATLIEILSRCDARAIIFDIIFSEPGDKDVLLAEAAKRSARVYFPYSLALQGKERGLLRADGFDATLLPALANAAQGTGFANVLTDRDGKRRRLPLFIEHHGALLKQLSFSAASDYLGIAEEEMKIIPRHSVKLGRDISIPIDDEAATLVNLAGTWSQTFHHYSYFDILMAYAQQAPTNSGLLAQLKGKVCFIGLTATGTSDLNPTALEPVYPMVGLHANLFNAVTTKNFLRRLPRPANIVILYLLSILSVLFAQRLRPPKNILYCLGTLLLFVGTGFVLFIFGGLWIDLFLPILAYMVVFLAASLLRYMRELHQRELLEKELAIAKNIQQSFLRELPEQLEGADIAASMETAKHVGGDLYDCVQFSDGRLGLMVGDVSGKGVPAALFMAQVISQFRRFANSSATPAQTLSHLNDAICRDSQTGLFVTIVYLIYNPLKQELSIASAGHLPALIFSQGELKQSIELAEGMPIGLVEGSEFSEQQVKLSPADLVLLYTDGVTEARNIAGADFEEKGINLALKGQPELSSREAVEALKKAMNAFVGRAAQHDDITVMVLKVK